MNAEQRVRTTGLMAALLTAALTMGALADTIAMRASVRLPEDADAVRLHHIAQLEGEAAEALADLVVAGLPRSTKPITLDIRTIRKALDEAGVHWGHVNLSGRMVVVRPAANGLSAGPGAMQAAAIEGAKVDPKVRNRSGREHLAAELIDAPTLQGALTRYLVERLATPADRIRLTFDHAAQPQLDTATTAYRFEIKPDGSMRSDRIAFTVRFWADNAIQRTERITVHPTLLLRAAVPSRDLDRGETVTAQNITIVAEWMKPSVASGVCPADVCLGRIATTRLKAGAPIKTKHVQREKVVERGDRVAVRCLVGGVVISLQAEARADGSVGDIIELRKAGEKATFTATVTGPGEAVVDLSRAAPPASPSGS